jgi:hypothetical protein
VKNRAWIVLLLVSLGVNIGFLLHWAWPKVAAGRDAGARSGWHAGAMRRHFGLSSEQAQRMESERQKVLAQAKPFQDALRQKRRDLFLLMKDRDVRDADLDAPLAEIARLQAAIEKIYILHAVKVRGLFSPAQLRKYEGCLERGLCPGMMTKAACPRGPGSGRGMGGTGCAGMGEKKR